VTDPCAWSPQSTADFIVDLFIRIGWWGVALVGVLWATVKNGWPWAPRRGKLPD
jgi:hypothetical protein